MCGLRKPMAGERRRIGGAARLLAEDDPLAREALHENRCLIPELVTKRNLAIGLIIIGVVVFVLGYLRSDPRFARPSTRPYAYISIMAIGAICMIGGGLLWRDR